MRISALLGVPFYHLVSTLFSLCSVATSRDAQSDQTVLLGSGVSTACRCVGTGYISSSRSSGNRIHRGFESPLPFAVTHAAARPDTPQW